LFKICALNVQECRAVFYLNILPCLKNGTSFSAKFFPFSISVEKEKKSAYILLHNNTDKKEIQIFLIYKEIQSGAIAKSYMRKGFLIDDEMRKYFPIYEKAVSHI
jgi:hypothetical protein